MSTESKTNFFDPFALFMLAVVGVVFAVKYAWIGVTVWSSCFVKIHEYAHLFVAKLLGVRAVEQGHTDSHYEIQFEAHSPEQNFYISYAPILLSPLAFALIWFSFNTSVYLGIPVFAVSFAIAMQSFPSDLDVFSVVFDVTRVSPLASLLSSLISLPLALLYAPAIIMGKFWVFVVQFGFAASLAYLAYHSASLAEPLAVLF